MFCIFYALLCQTVQIYEFHNFVKCKPASFLRVGDDLIFWSNQKFVSPVPGSYFLHNSESKLWSCWGHRGRRMQAMWWKRADTAEESQYYYSTNIIIEKAGGSLASYISTLTVWFYWTEHYGDNQRFTMKQITEYSLPCGGSAGALPLLVLPLFGVALQNTAGYFTMK